MKHWYWHAGNTSLVYEKYAAEKNTHILMNTFNDKSQFLRSPHLNGNDHPVWFELTPMTCTTEPPFVTSPVRRLDAPYWRKLTPIILQSIELPLRNRSTVMHLQDWTFLTTWAFVGVSSRLSIRSSTRSGRRCAARGEKVGSLPACTINQTFFLVLLKMNFSGFFFAWSSTKNVNSVFIIH